MTNHANHLRRSPEAVFVETTRPEVTELLLPGEGMIEFSARKYRKMYGTALGLLGVTLTVDPIVRFFASFAFGVEFLLGLLLLYAAAREFFLSRREFVCVTDQRLLYRKVDWLGRPGKCKEIAISTITSAKLCQRAMAWRDTFAGEVLMHLENGGQYVTVHLENGQYILDAIRAVKSSLPMEHGRSFETSNGSDPSSVHG